MLRLKELREERKINMRQAAKALGIPYTTYISYEKGDREPNSEMLIVLADFYNCSIDYLVGRSEDRIDDSVLDKANAIEDDVLAFYGNLYEAQKAQQIIDSNPFTGYRLINENEAEMVKKYRTLDEYGKRVVDTVLDIEAERCIQSDESEPSDVIEIRISQLAASAGTGDPLGDEVYETITVKRTPESERADFAIRVDGDSMETTFSDGDILLVESTPQINAGDIGIFVVNGEGYVKEFGGDRLISHNTAYGDIMLHDYDMIMCSGKVIGTAEIV